MNSKQVVAVASAVVLVVILVYPAVAVGTVSVSMGSTRISKADHIFVTIDRVWAHPKNQASGVGWVVIANESVSADLVSLQGSTRSLGSGQVASGEYDRIRIEVSNASWIFNSTTTNLGVASREIDATIDFTVGAASTTNVLVTLAPQEELIANSEYFTGTLNATLTT